jgi:hypothetical protein
MEIKQAFTVLRHECVEIHQRANSLRNSIGDAGDYDATVRVSTENYIRKLFPSQQVENVRDVS